MASPSTSHHFPLATEQPYSNPDIGPPEDPNVAGASGSSSANSVELSEGALIAIIVVVCVVGIFGIASAVLFYMAKQREWTVRETLRRSARKVVTALTPRRTEFPRSVKDVGGGGGAGSLSMSSSSSSSRGRRGVRIADEHDLVPPTPRLSPERLLDLEKGGAGAAGLDPAGAGALKKSRINFSRK